jgi:asparaginyl-tRNA synthetase
MQKKSLPLPYLRDHAHVRFRTAHPAAVMRVRDALMREWHDWFEVRIHRSD